MTSKLESGDRLKLGILNPQGHLRWKKQQIACHPDTGGQIVYVIELARALERLGCDVDVFTRYFKDPEWPGYDTEIEKYNENMRIIRIKCGPEDKFVRKEDLWILMRDFADRIKEYYEQAGYMPDIFSSHYGDGGIAAAMLKKKTGIPYAHTGHSLGGKKMDILSLSKLNFKKINDNYKFHLRIAAERISFRNSRAIITSTTEEIEKQYGHKVYKVAPKDKSKFNVIPPGIDPYVFFNFAKEEPAPNRYEKAIKRLKKELERDIMSDRLNMPFIFSAARFSAKKNPAGLVSAYADSETLKEKMNLLIVAGNVEDPLKESNRSKFESSKREIVDKISNTIKEYGIEGMVCFAPGLDHEEELPYIYRYAARNKWIFINPALHEPFGLTIVEAMASGLPVVATKRGGPSEILDNNRYGILVEPTDSHSINGGLKKMLKDGVWEKYSDSGIERVREHYTWDRTAKNYLDLFRKILKKGSGKYRNFEIPAFFTDPSEENKTKLIKEFKRRYYIGGR
ncbi:MAG: glycosyltransferase [Elusimicrobiota bacterium]